jgi:hypothetical protein
MAPRFDSVAVIRAPANHLPTWSGLVLAAATATWWLGSTRLALDNGADPARCARDTLQALLLVRGTAVAFVAVRVGGLSGLRAGIAAALALIAPAWPLVLLAWSASAVGLSRVILAECMLVAVSTALPLIGVGLRRWLRSAELAVLAGTGVGAALAVSAWLTLGVFFGPSA